MSSLFLIELLGPFLSLCVILFFIFLSFVLWLSVFRYYGVWMLDVKGLCMST